MNFSQLLNDFRKLKVLVIGDIMLDEYLYGSAERISREAPVLVVKQKKKVYKLGGAANVAQNIRSLGAQVYLMGIVGADPNGKILLDLLNQEGHPKENILIDSNRITTTKTRVLASHNHQVLRIDQEEYSPLEKQLTEQILEQIKTIVNKIDIVLFSDYNQGTITEPLVQYFLNTQLPIVSNPRPETLHLYQGIDLISFNQEESTKCLGIPYDISLQKIENISTQLLKKAGTKYTLLTLGEEGMIATSKHQHIRIKASKVEVYDTCGAGDTVIAAVTLGYKVSGFKPEIFQLASHLGAKVVQHIGVVTPTTQDLQDLYNL